MFSSFDQDCMQRAIELARRGLFSTTPNPRVGCVLAKDGQIIAEGWHERAGEAHAEAMALQKAGGAARGTTAYVTLEPCSFHGRTPACSQSLLQAGVSRVVCAMLDPHSKVAGTGVSQLREAGLRVDVGLLEQEAAALNPGHCKRFREGLPYVRCKMAASLDGRTAMASGESQWITGPPARQQVQTLRAESCAIISGIETVLQDNARLTVRAEQLNDERFALMRGRQPLRVLFDSQGRCPADAAIAQAQGSLLLAVGSEARLDGHPLAGRSDVQFWCDQAERPRPRAVLQHLASLECNEVLLESGPVLAASFLQAGLIDELIVFMAAKLMGSSARPMFDFSLDAMTDSVNLRIESVETLGDDLHIVARPAK